jgi:23S rRNA-/tRNA-specific pseudouridylate synthase
LLAHTLLVSENDSKTCVQVLLDDGKTDRVVLAQGSGFEASQDAITEYKVLGPKINGCSWVELRPITSRKHQVLVKLCYPLYQFCERFCSCFVS